MHNPFATSVNADVKLEFKHAKFDEILQIYKPSVPNADSVRVLLIGHHNNSDIKLNNFAGTFTIQAYLKDQIRATLCSAGITCFTGNCGVKSVDHLYLYGTNQISADVLTAVRKELVKIVESLAFHKMNCGLLIGSDTNCQSYRGETLRNIMQFGEGYVIDDPVWNPNYSHQRSHTISLFRKDLTHIEHVNYWNA
jgi:hypothetical protein